MDEILRFNFKKCQSLVSTSETENQMKGGFLLNVVVTESSAILKLFASKYQPLLVWWDSFLVLDLCFYIFNGVRWFNFQCNGFTSESLNKNLHSTTETQDQMKSGFFLDVVVTESSAILKLLSSKDQPLLVWWDSFLVLDLCFYIFNGVRWFNFQSNGFTSESLHKDLHSTTETQDQMKSGFLLNVVVTESSAILKLLSSKDQPLLVWWDSF